MHNGHIAGIRYRVVVRGQLGDQLVDQLDGLECEPGTGGCALVGTFDQAALHGLLDRLRDLGIQLVSVNPLD
jgi:hypothetical protein